MKWFNRYRIRLFLGGFTAAIVLSGGNASAEFIWGTAVNLGPNVNSSSNDAGASISADGLTLFFMRNPGPPEIWASTRRTTDDDFGARFKLPSQVNMPGYDNGIPNLSADGSTLYFLSSRPGGFGDWDLWQVPITPIVDFNGDGIVDSVDMCMMVDYWGTDEPLYDIAPLPFGDNIVDVKDLIILAEHLLPVFPAHWELDETEGSVAYDSAGDHDGTLNGDPLWHPAGGKVNGSLMLDGIDDYVSTPFILDAAKRSFSAFAWIKGGGPGQTIVSQTNGFGWGGSWLCADLSNGRLATVLMDPQPALVSESVITDGTWHHIGLVWDESYRYLYVDGAEVAKDAASLSYAMPCDGGLYLGAGKTLDNVSFFSGLIDDICIYNKALSLEEIAALAQ